MVLFILKSSACLAIFLMFYKLLLEKEHMHIFKRYYLLAALVVALLIPSIAFTEYVEMSPVPSPITSAPVETSNQGILIKESDEIAMPTNKKNLFQDAKLAVMDYGPGMLWTIYGLGIVLFGLKFLINLRQIVSNVLNHPKKRIDSIIHVLIKDNLVPHTFWNYLFLNRKKYEAGEIPREVLLHEATHARQRHSLDVLFVELLQIVFWFNPLIHFTKKAIKLNHEFLADAAVLDQGASTPHYQNTVLAFASSAEYEKYQPSMANAIHYSSYSSIKKRFTVMKTQTSKKSILFRCLLIMPLLALLLYGFSTSVQIPKPMNDDTALPDGATTEQLAEYNALAKKYYELPIGPVGGNIDIGSTKGMERLNQIYLIMTTEQKANAEPFPMPNFAKPSKPDNSFQEGATKIQLDEYNALAKKYNTMLADNGNIRIEKSEVDRLEYLHGIMTEEQRANAEPFPDFPEPPEPPQPPVPPAPPSLDIEMEAQIEKQRAILQEQEVEMRRQADRVKVQGGKRKEQQVRMQGQVAQMKAQRKKLSRHREKMARQQKAMERQRYKIEEERMLLEEHQTEMEKQKALGLEEAKIEEHVIREIIEKQEIIAKEHPLETFPLWYLTEEGETKIYLEGKEISYSKMKKMERDGMITSMNIIKKPNGNSLIKLNETGFRPQTPPVPPKPKSPVGLLEELKKDNVKIIFNGKEITYEMAEKVLEEDDIINVKVNRENGKRPVMELSSE